uniref:Glycosyl transferase CAP10 domain-containing protein n=1 Tax=Micromonas pusilla TaxID=38833 RepID=A0A7S0IN63_MICPS|mmetsp:Transcript_9639/g.39473  ORF Transcript_9639/g.39473 Transcript_9639/m.39473 type:complete len:417 (+) Transcript_9639:230-1480(+)
MPIRLRTLHAFVTLGGFIFLVAATSFTRKLSSQSHVRRLVLPSKQNASSLASIYCERLGYDLRECRRFSLYSGGWAVQLDPHRIEKAQDELCKLWERKTKLGGRLSVDEIHIVDRADLEKCLRGENTSPSLNKAYCRDAMAFFDTGVPVKHMIALFGDRTADGSNLPLVTKARRITDVGNRTRILWPLNIERHFGPLRHVGGQDINWEAKAEKLVWRGVDTGFEGERARQIKTLRANNAGLQRLIDVAFSSHLLNPENAKYSRPWMTIGELLRNKYLLSLEGNDVASGLKWMLYSRSVVFMPPPRCETWAMESALQPYVHYIPIEHDLSNLEARVAWARSNDAKCVNISRAATSFVKLFLNYSGTTSPKKSDISLKQGLVTLFNDVMANVTQNFQLSRCAFSFNATNGLKPLLFDS